jgi:hypothetical protein
MKMEGEGIKNPVNILYPLLVGQRLFSFSLFSLNSSARLPAALLAIEMAVLDWCVWYKESSAMPTEGKQIKFSGPIRFEHLIAVSIKDTVCWNVTPCILLNNTFNRQASASKMGPCYS